MSTPPRLTVKEALALAAHTKAVAEAILALEERVGVDDPHLVAIAEAFAVVTAMLGKATGSQQLARRDHHD